VGAVGGWLLFSGGGGSGDGGAPSVEVVRESTVP
jgi:hypothetical protein